MTGVQTCALPISNAGFCVEDCYYAGQLGIVQLQFAPPAPCNECDFESGIVINVRPDSITPYTRYLPMNKFYGTRLPSVTSTSGYVDDAFVLQVEDAILEGLAGDLQRFADGYRTYNISGVDDFADPEDDIIFTLVEADGTEHDIDVDAGASLAATVIVLQAALDAVVTGYTVVANGTAAMYIVGPANTKFTITDFDDTDVTLEGRYLRIAQKYLDSKIDVSYDVAHATQTSIQTARLPYLRGVDVAAIFATYGNHGTLGMFANTPQVDLDAEYCKYVLKRIHRAYDDPAANRINSYFEEVNIYVKKTAAETDYWIGDGDSDTAYGMNVDAAPDGVADTDFNDACALLCDGADPLA